MQREHENASSLHANIFRAAWRGSQAREPRDSYSQLRLGVFCLATILGGSRPGLVLTASSQGRQCQSRGTLLLPPQGGSWPHGLC